MKKSWETKKAEFNIQVTVHRDKFF